MDLMTRNAVQTLFGLHTVEYKPIEEETVNKLKISMMKLMDFLKERMEHIGDIEQFENDFMDIIGLPFIESCDSCSGGNCEEDLFDHQILAIFKCHRSKVRQMEERLIKNYDDQLAPGIRTA